MVRISACINNYNYGRYLGEAIDSVFAQTYPPLEVIVVDDGSTDGSADFVAETYGDRVRLIRSENLGQLSAVRLGVRAATGDFIAFLDADDRWEAHHLAEVAMRLSADRLADFVIASKRVFGMDAPSKAISRHVERVFGCTTLVGLTGEDVGAETSCLVTRRDCVDFLDRIPPEMLAEWRLYADEVIVFGCSIRGARKVWIGVQSVAYRAHGENGHFGRVSTSDEERSRRERHQKLIDWLHRSYFPGMNAAAIVRREMKRNTLIKQRNKRRLYRAVWRCRASLGEKVAATFAILAKR